ncbi:hypothetical protein DPMN_184509, partial [Dreissena polymorpha]
CMAPLPTLRCPLGQTCGVGIRSMKSCCCTGPSTTAMLGQTSRALSTGSTQETGSRA